MKIENELLDIMGNQIINTYFQPIITADGQSIFAYEALSRGPSGSVLFNPVNLFEQARSQKKLLVLEQLCRTKAIEQFVQQQLPGKLFLNISPEILLQPEHHRGFTLELVNTFGVSPEQVVIEIAGYSPIHDYELMRNAVKHYQDEGFSIALDDLGTGYSSLRLWSEVKPDFVKIDRHFISGIEKDKVKRDFVRSIVTIARSVESRVIAEGVESLHEFEALCETGVDYMQGYYFGRPGPNPIRELSSGSRIAWQQVKGSHEIYIEQCQVGQLKQDVPPIGPDASIEQAAAIFEQNPQWFSLVVVGAKGVPLGVVQRSQLLGALSRPFGRDLYAKKGVCHLMDEKFISVERHTRLESVSQLVTGRERNELQDDFVITQKGAYYGIGQVMDLLKMITEMQLKSAQHANPLTGLPGNVLIQEHIDNLIISRKPFVACYFDLDNFKPYNDEYGYAKGDVVLLAVAKLLRDSSEAELDFVGHVGGDDFVVVFRSLDWQERIRQMLESFAGQCHNFYNSVHIDGQGIWAEDRFGEKRFFSLLSISAAAIDSSSSGLESAAMVSSRLTPIKTHAKNAKGNALVAELNGKVVELFIAERESA